MGQVLHDPPPELGPFKTGNLLLLLCTQSLERPRLEFRACFHDDGLGAPSGFCSEIGDLLPIAPCGRTSL
jgi:hypothetical protein